LFLDLNIAILILAAGESKRMGTPKQLLKWNNTTLLGHTIQTSEELNLKTFVVLGANFETIKASFRHHDIQIIKNKNWKNGLGSSIAFGAKHIINFEPDIDALLIMLADQPLISSEYLSSMISEFKKGKNKIAASSYKDGKKGVPALFDKIYFKELTQVSNDKGAKLLIEKNIKNVVLLNAESVVSDIDTLEDYQQLYMNNH
jgi:molybdenum cofactor cytidylyltransferase